ncbi:MAG: hypothetical protein AAF329_06390 [Cyanobacteria bacterium P01_A01_bin.17]
MASPKERTLVPAKGRLVPLEDGSAWPTKEVGKDDEKTTVPKEVKVTMTRFYRRRLKDGDLIDVNAQKESAGTDAGNKKNGGTKKSADEGKGN